MRRSFTFLSAVSLLVVFSLMVSCLSFEKGKDAAFMEKVLFLSYRTVFRSKAEGYLAYRKPLFVQAGETIFAFAEGRKGGFYESGDIDIVYKRSTDGGKSWSALAVALDEGNNALTRASVGVFPLPDGKLRMVLAVTQNLGSDYESEIIEGKSKEKSKVFICYSDDFALTWSEKQEITAQVKKEEWNWVSTISSPLLFLENEKRLILPCQHYDKAVSGYRSHVAYSDDFGISWRIGAIAEAGTGEMQLVHLEGKKLVAAVRTYSSFFSTPSQLILFSDNGGESFSPQKDFGSLIDSGCQSSLLFDRTRSAFFFCNPADTKRQRLSLKKGVLKDSEGGLKEGLFSWEELLVLWKGPASFSSMILHEDSLLILFERGKDFPYEGIAFSSVNSEILNNLPTPAKESL